MKYNGKFVVIMLCSKCNNKCKHCYVNYSGEFSENELDEIIPKLLEKYIVVLNGTEPILYPNYFKYFKMIGQYKILTNGIALINNNELMEQLKENGITEIGLSYHFGIHDQISMVKTYMLDKLIRQLKENGFTVRLLTSVSKDNCSGIEDYCKKAIELGADKIKFTNMIMQGNAKENIEKEKILDEKEIYSFLNRIENLRTQYPKNELCIERCGTFGNSIQSSNFECLAGQNMAVITPDKKVYQCVFDISPNNDIGFLNDKNEIIIDEDKINYDKSYCKVLKKYNKV